MYDLLVRGGRVVDPAQGIDGAADIGVSQGRIATIGEGLKVEEATQVVEAQGKVVVPGLIDLHAHVYEAVTWVSVAPDRAGVDSGVTTVVDAGSAGWATFPGLAKFLLPQSRTSVFCFLHICRTGLCHMPEIRDWNDIDHGETVAMARAYPDLIKGIKVRVVEPAVWNMGLELIKLAKRIAGEVGLPLMVHIGDPRGIPTRTLTRELLPLLDSGDILSHCFTGKAGNVLQSDGTVMPEFREAAERGVVLDIAHGMNNFSFDVARRGMDQGILPHTISTDLASLTIDGPVFSLVHTLSEFMALGLSLEQVIEMSTINPARALKEDGRMGSLKADMPADISILELKEGDWEFRDSENQTLQGQWMLKPMMVVKGGVPISST
jgi:dihydroorotase